MVFGPTVAAIQINVFECGGVTICVSISHKVADGFTVAKFINVWSTTCKLGLNYNAAVQYPSFHLASIFPPRENYKPNLPKLKSRAKLVTKRIVFGRTSTSSLKARPSRVEMVTALVWRALMGVARVKNNRFRASLATHSLNLRGETATEIPDVPCGNLYTLFGAHFLAKEGILVELHDLVTLQRNAMEDTIEECRKAQNGEDLCLMMLNCWENVIGKEKRGEVDLNLSTSLCRFPLNEADFGWGRPIWVSSVHKPVEMVIFFDTKCGAGVEAWVTLQEKDMIQFQQDIDIVTFTTSH